MNTTERYCAILERYHAALSDQHSPNENALYHLLVGFSGLIHPLLETPAYFHMAFRKVDVAPVNEKLPELEAMNIYGGLDSAIWYLLQDAPIFWAIFAEEFFADKGDTE